MQGRLKAALRTVCAISTVAGLAYAPASQAIRFDTDWFGGISGTLNTSLAIGAQWRIQDRDKSLIGAANLDPQACRSVCQPHLSTPPGTVPGRLQLGLDGEGPRVNQLGLDTGGAASINNDDGNLNFDKYEVTQAVAQITQDLTLEFGDVLFVKGLKFFGRYNAFHDFVNYNRDTFYNNFYTQADRANDDALRASGNYGFPTVGTQREGAPQARDKYNEYLGQDIDVLDFFVQGYLPIPFTDREFQLTVGEQIINWGENTLLVVNSLNVINPPNLNALFRPAFLELATVFEPIGAVKVSMPLTLNTSFEAFYQYDWERVEIPPAGGFLSFIDITLGTDNNNINPGFGQAPDDRDGNASFEQELLAAIADIDGQVPVSEEPASKGGQYGFALTWFLPDFNNGTELRFYYANYHSRLPYFSAFAGSESCLQSAPTGEVLADTVNLLADCPNADLGQFLGAATANAGTQDGGVDIGNPVVGQLTTVVGALVNSLPIEATGTQPNGAPCPTDLPAGSGPCAEGYPIDTFRGLLEYPEDIHMFGISFNTSFGSISVQGEIAYRPNLPLQVDDTDVVFAALQPASPVGCSNSGTTDQQGNPVSQNRGPDCQPGSFADRYAIGLPAVGGLLDAINNGGDILGALGNLTGLPTGALGGVVDQLTDLLATTGIDLQALADALGPIAGENILLSDPPGRANAFPDFLTEYRGQERGNIAPGQYIQGYERFQVFQYNLGATYVVPPGNWIKASQIILLFELGAEHVLGFPERDELQIEGDGTFYHASVGTDGSGAPACAPGTVQGEAPANSPDADQANTTLCGRFQGTRFNPRQQTDGFATQLSYGARVIALIRYENVLPGISFRPVVVVGYDIHGTSPGPGPTFIEGRQMYTANVEMAMSEWSVVAGFTIFRGAEPFNLISDRDFVQLGVRYQF